MKRQIIGLALATAFFGAVQAQAFVIDDFDVSNANLVSGNCAAVIAGVVGGQCVGISAKDATKTTDIDTLLPFVAGVSGTVGGRRDFAITNPTATFGSGFATAGANIDGTKDFQYSQGPGFETVVTTIYDGDDTQGNFGSGLTDGVGGVDLTDGGTSDILAWFITSLDLNVRVTVILKDGDGTTSGNAFLKIPDLAPGVPAECDPGMSPHGVPGNPIVCVTPPGLLVHGLALFNGPSVTDPATGFSFYDDPFTAGADLLLAPTGGVGGLNLTDIVAIKIIYDTILNDGNGTLDLAEDMFFSTASIPEPGTVLLLGTGLLVLGLSGMRKRFGRRQ